jgi:hypothetical protein
MDRKLQLVCEEDAARIYLCTPARHADDGDLHAYARERINHLRAACDVRTVTQRSMQIGKRPAVQYTSSVRLADSRPFHYVASFVESSDHRWDEIIGDGTHLDTILPGYRAFLEEFAYVPR